MSIFPAFVTTLVLSFSVTAYGLVAKPDTHVKPQPRTSAYVIKVCSASETDAQCAQSTVAFCKAQGFDDVKLDDFLLEAGEGSKLFAIKVICSNGGIPKALEKTPAPAPGSITL